MKLRSLVAVFFGILLGLSATQARAWSPIPAYPKDGTVAVGSDASDVYDGLRVFLRHHQSPVGAQYHVAIVAFTDAQNRSGPDFGDENAVFINKVVEAWKPKVDPQTGVIILLGIENHDVIVHPFSRWARLGWEQQEVTATIDASPFKSYARAGDYGAAIEALIGSIDSELGRRVREDAGHVAAAKREASLARARIDGYEPLVQQEAFDPPKARGLRDAAVSLLEQSQRALDDGRSRQAEQLAHDAGESASEALSRVRSLKDLAATAKAKRNTVAKSRDAFAVKVAHADGDVHAALARENEAAQDLMRAQVLLDHQLPEEALQTLEGAERALGQGEELLESAAELHAFKTRVLPGLGLGVLALLAGFLLLRAHRAALGRKATAEALFAQWEAMLARAAERLLKLEDEHALVLGARDLGQRYQGESAAPALEAARAVDDLFLAYETAQRLLSDVKYGVRHAGAFGAGRWAAAVDRLTVTQVLARTEDVKTHRLFLPEQREVWMTPPKLLSEMESAYALAVTKVEALDATFTSVWAKLDGLKQAAAALAQLEARLVKAGAPSPARADVENALAKAQALHSTARTDPLGAEASLDGAVAEVAGLTARYQRFVDCAETLRDLFTARRSDAQKKVQALRDGGLPLKEPGFDPEAALASAERTARTAADALKDGRDEEAVAAAKQACVAIERLVALCDRAKQASVEGATDAKALGARTQALRAKLPERKERIDALRQQYADQSLQPALDNAEEAASVLTEADAALGEANAALAAARHLAAADQLARAEQRILAVENLYEEIESRADALASARLEANKALAAASTHLALVSTLLGAGDDFASQATLDESATLKQRTEALIAAANSVRPDFLEVRRGADAALRRCEALAARAQGEKDAFGQARALQQELSTRRTAFGQLLEARTDDRAETNARFAEVSKELDEALARSAGRPSWPEVLAALARSAEGLESVRRMAEADFAGAAGARKALAEADHEIKIADVPYAYGVTADLAKARAAMKRARTHMQAQQYAEAAKAAEEARVSARSAGIDAKLEEGRVTGLGTRPTYGFSLEPLSDPSPSSSSWGSSSRHDSLFGGSSSGSLFGSGSSSFGSSSFGSSSGGSSFGSSSGSSSFGSSSGRSKW